jgi:hypothetical protein
MALPSHRSTPTPATIALLCGLVPLLTVHVCYVLSASAGVIPTCSPYLDGCTSISATGRHGWGYVLFKAGMKYELRVDENDKPFFWIATLKR